MDDFDTRANEISRLIAISLLGKSLSTECVLAGLALFAGFLIANYKSADMKLASYESYLQTLANVIKVYEDAQNDPNSN